MASAVGYTATFPTPQSRLQLARSLGTNAGLAALVGPARHIETVAGFTAWRTLGILSIVGAFWGLLLATRLLRGEEEAGRWELLLAGPTTRGRATVRATVGLGAGVLALWAVTALCAVACTFSSDVDFNAGGALFLSVALVASAAMFVAVGVVTSQLAGTRRQANAIGAAVIGVAFLARMVADAGTGLLWLRWVSPLGWVEELRPLAGSHWLPLVPIVATTLGFTAVATTLAARRDLGASALPQGDARPPRVWLLNGPTGLTVRLTLPVGLGWIGALTALGLVLGLVSESAAAAVSGSNTIERALGRVGGTKSGAAAYIGLAFIFAAALVTFVAAAQIAAARNEEASGRLDGVLVRPVSRARWLAGRLAAASGLIAVAGVAAGVAAWAGAATQHTGLSVGQLVEAGINVVPPALFVLGLGALVYGVLGRPAPVIAYAVVTWSFLVQLIAILITTNRFLLDSSVLHHVAPAPATAPNWGSALGLAGLGVALMATGIAAFTRRDLTGE